MERDVSRAFSTYPSGSPARNTSLQFPFTELPQRETPHLQSPIQPYLKVLGRWTHSRLPNWAPIKKDAHPQRLQGPKQRIPPPGSPDRAPIERDAPSPETRYNYHSEFPVNRPPWGDVHPLSTLPQILPSPQKGDDLTELPQRKMLPFRSPPKYSVNDSTGSPTGPWSERCPSPAFSSTSFPQSPR